MIHAEKDRPAAECSTGEQKALILNLVLAQAARLARAERRPARSCCSTRSPPTWTRAAAPRCSTRSRRFGLQAFLTGTDELLFAEFASAAQGLRVEGSELAPLAA